MIAPCNSLIIYFHRSYGFGNLYVYIFDYNKCAKLHIDICYLNYYLQNV